MLSAEKTELLNVTALNPWLVVQFEWGAAIKHKNGKWEKAVLRNGQEIDVSEMNVILHDNGIEFCL